MMENTQAQSLLDRLGGKVSQMVQQLQSLKEENEVLKNDLMNHQVVLQYFVLFLQ